MQESQIKSRTLDARETQNRRWLLVRKHHWRRSTLKRKGPRHRCPRHCQRVVLPPIHVHHVSLAPFAASRRDLFHGTGGQAPFWVGTRGKTRVGRVTTHARLKQTNNYRVLGLLSHRGDPWGLGPNPAIPGPNKQGLNQRSRIPNSCKWIISSPSVTSPFSF
jgi:hypothetical protein